MRLIYVTASLPHASGETFVIPEIQEILRKGHEVKVVPCYPRGPIIHADVLPLVERSVSESLFSPRVALGAVAAAVRAPLRSARAAFMLGESRTAKIFAKNAVVSAKALWLARLAEDFGADHIHAHWASTSSTMAMLAAEIAGIPWSMTAHRWDIPENNLLREKGRSARFIRAIDLAGAEEISAYLDPDSPRPLVIHMGVTLGSPPTSQPWRLKGRGRLLTAARFVQKKGHHVLIDAVARLKTEGFLVDVDLAGDGPLREHVVAAISQRGLADQIRLLGELSHEELLTRMSKGEWNVVVLPSIIADDGDREGIPVSLMEAMACGVPVISTDTGGTRELLCGGAGVMVKQRNPRDLSDAIRRIFEDESMRKTLSANGRLRVEQDFSLETVVDTLLGLFAQHRKATLV